MELLSTDRSLLSQQEFADCLRESESYTLGTPGRKDYVDGSVERLHRIFRNMLACDLNYEGPSLDIASGWGILFPAVRRYLPQAMPYSIAEMSGGATSYDGHEIACYHFECDKDKIPCEDNRFGLVLFNDILEHLIVDPVWTMLEINRVTKMGGGTW